MYRTKSTPPNKYTIAAERHPGGAGVLFDGAREQFGDAGVLFGRAGYLFGVNSSVAIATLVNDLSPDQVVHAKGDSPTSLRSPWAICRKSTSRKTSRASWW